MRAQHLAQSANLLYMYHPNGYGEHAQLLLLLLEVPVWPGAQGVLMTCWGCPGLLLVVAAQTNEAVNAQIQARGKLQLAMFAME